MCFEAKENYIFLKEAEKVNTDILVKNFKYNKFTLKILMMKIKNHQQFIDPKTFDELQSQALRDAGVKSFLAPNIMALKAENLSKKGDHVKAVEYIHRALKLAAEVLDGVKIHKKYLNILFYKSEIYQRKKLN